MMSRKQFEEAVTPLLKREPFRPFVIEMESGDQFLVDTPEALHHYAGSATYFHSDGEMDFVDAENVRALREVIASPTN